MKAQRFLASEMMNQMVHAAIVSVATYSAQICQDPRCSIRLSGSIDRPADGEEDPVVTPGGPHPRNKVHHVRPGEAVRRNQDGTYTIVPNDVPAPPEPKPKTED
jgi:hypothetical protein